ncbi:MAG: rhomboid family intramembrane serine protease [Myxococcota bacterium]|nr:rhomboid family intramembrane serine protease [Myxococcota bacterium]
MIVEVKRKSHIQQMTYEDFEERIRDGEIPPETMVRFEVVTGEHFRPVRELELYHALADPQRMAFRKRLTKVGIPLVTCFLVGIQIRIYMISGLNGAEDWLEQNLTNWAPGIIEQGQVYRLFSYGLLQTSFTHLLFNLVFLAYTAYHLERALGRTNLALLYFFSVFTGGLLSMFMAPERPSLGASGGVFGLLAAVVVLGWKHWENLPRESRKHFGWALAPYLGFSIISGLSSENVDNWGHLGGLVGGMVLMTMLDPVAMSERRVRNTRIRQVALGSLLAVSVTIYIAGTRLVDLTRNDDEHGWHVSRPEQWREGWTFTGDRGWFSPTLQANLSIATIVHPRPISAAAVTDNLIDRIDSGGKEPQIVIREALKVQGWDACRLVMVFELSDEPQHLTALVLARGVYEHRVQFQALSEAVASYEPLVARVLNSVLLTDPDELVEARRRHRFHPRSWEPARELGDAWYRAGKPAEAVKAYEQALGIDPTDLRPLVGLLRVHADYGVPGGLETAREALQRAPGSLKVLEAAADVLAAEGQESEGIALLDGAWTDLPGNPILRRIRLQWGLPVTLEPSEPAEAQDAAAPR